jgi:hypothetical protein
LKLDDLPKECGFCGVSEDDAEDGLSVSVSLGKDMKPRMGAVCVNCIRVCILTMAHYKPEKFEKLVAEARNWKPGDP